MAHENRDTSQHDRPAGTGSDWTSEDRYWRENFASRPYASTDRGYDYYQPGYQYGYEAAKRHRGRQWSDVEGDLERGWSSSERGSSSKWQEVKQAVKDAWDRVT